MRASQSEKATTSPALSRITFREESATKPLHHVVDAVKEEASMLALHSPKTMIVLAGRSRRMAVESLGEELGSLTSGSGSVTSTVPRTLGDVGAALALTGANASILIFQASSSSLL